MQPPKDAYEKTADIYDFRHSGPTTKWMRKIEKNFLRGVSGRTLDIGCGTGYHLSFLKNTTGVDVSKSMLKEARKKGKPVLLADGKSLPFRNGSFDTVLCMFSVLNVSDYKAIAKEIRRVTRKYGTALVSVASVYDKGYGFREKKKLKIDSYSQVKKFFIRRERVSMHLFRKRELRELFEGNGFLPIDFDSVYMLVKPRWCSMQKFSIREKIMLMLERLLPREYGCLYFMVFMKIW